MRYIFIILLWLTCYTAFAQTPQTNGQQSSNSLVDTATLNALKDSMGNRIGQIFDIDMLMQCFQVRQISSIGTITLLTKNTALADTVNKFQKDYDVNLMVHSFIDSKQFWPNVLFSKNKLSDWTTNTKNKPGVGFDIRFTPQGTNWLNRTFKADIGNGATDGLLDSVKLKKVKEAENSKLQGPYGSIPRDTINQAVFKGINVLRGMFKEQTDQCNLSQVTFSPCTAQSYGFDVLPNEALRSYYDQLTLKGRPYEIPWKSVAAGSTDSVRIKIEKSDKSSPTHKVLFRSSVGSNLMLKQNADSTYTLTLTGRSNKDEEIIEAYYIDTLPTKKTKEYVIGKLKIKTYAPVTKKVTPILLNGVNFTVTPAELKKVLNNIYKQAATQWEVNEPVKVTVNKDKWDLDNNGILKIETSPLSRYSEAMQAIVDAIEKSVTPDPETYYVVITNLPNNYNYAGYMPLKSQCAFLFVGTNTTEATVYHTAAHELGHGTFYLRHLEDEYKILDATHNLMDNYAGGNDLWKPQWDWIGDPSWRLYILQTEGDGACTGEDFFSQALRFIRAIRCAQKNGEKTVDLFFHNSDFSIKGHSFAVEFNWIANISSEKIRFQFIDNSITDDKTYFSYTEDVFDLTKFKFDDSHYQLRIPGKEFTLFISPEDMFASNRGKVYQFIKSIFNLQQSIDPPYYDFSKALSVLAYSKCELEALGIQRRKDILTEISNYISVVDKDEKAAITVISSTPPADKPLLYKFLVDNPKILSKLYIGIDDHRHEFMTEIFALWASQNESNKTISASLTLRQSFNGNVWKSPYVIEDQNNKLNFFTQDVVFVYGIDGTAVPKNKVDLGTFGNFDVLAVTFDGAYATKLQGKSITVPAIYIKYLLDKEDKKIGKETLVLASDVVLIFLSVGEVVEAVKLLGQAGKWLPKLVRLTLAAGNLTSVGLSTKCINSDSKFCKAWQKYETYVNIGLITAQTLPYVKNILLDLKNSRSAAPTLTKEQNQELDAILEGLDNVSRKTRLLANLNDYPNLTRMVNRLDEVADARLISKIEDLDAGLYAKLDEIYDPKNFSAPASQYRTPGNAEGNYWAKTRDGKYDVHFDNSGFPDFSRKEFCPGKDYYFNPEIEYPKGKTSITKLVGNEYSTDFTAANKWLCDKFGPTKVRTKGMKIEIKDSEGNWIEHSWEHCRDGNTLIPVRTDVHSQINHTGGTAMIKRGLQGVFEIF